MISPVPTPRISNSSSVKKVSVISPNQPLTTPHVYTNIGNMIPRFVQQNIISASKDVKKAILLLGPRQAGKTVVLKSLQTYFETQGKKTVYFNCDLAEDLDKIDTTAITLITRATTGIDYMLIDEAQRMQNPGLTIKIIHDNIPNIQVIATGSSSFELKNKLSDALTGRYVDFYLYPLSIREIISFTKPAKGQLLAGDLMLYGAYPEVYLQNQPDARRLMLSNITESYLFKDILSFSRIRNYKALQDLTRALAYQIGQEMNENELATRIKIDRKTLLSYLEILEQSFVIYRLYPYSQNPRREIGRKYKVYFVDLGIRNSLTGDFNPLNVRSDLGALWENFLVIERTKNEHLLSIAPQTYFWRSYNGSEVDWVEAEGKATSAWAFKYGPNSTVSHGGRVFTKNYQLPVKLVHSQNFLDTFI